MIKMWVLIMVVRGGGDGVNTSITQEFNSLETCQQAMASIKQQVFKVHSSGCYVK